MGTHPIFESDFDCLTEKKMSKPIKIPPKALNLSRGVTPEDPSGSPLDVARVGMAPKTFTTRRTRTTSVTQKIAETELEDGVVFAFSRPISDKEALFFHVSDVSGGIIPREDDHVKYRVIEIPPTYIKTQAVQVTLMNETLLLSQGRQKWTDEREKLAKTPNTPPSTPI